MTDLPAVAANLARRLRETGDVLVLAESCTGGLAAAAVVGVPGASEVFAGSFVTYQNASKRGWLGVPPSWLTDPGPVSREVAATMAERAAAKTPHASIAAAITGHLGPGAPAGENGRFIIAIRFDGWTAMEESRLPDEPSDRPARQAAAAVALLTAVRNALDGPAE